MSFIKRSIILATIAGLLPMAHSQPQESRHAGVSRSMQAAIYFYEKGEDTQAMDRFMEILTKGDPSERSMANEYINLITQRMNTSGGYGGNPAPRAGVATAEPVTPAAPVRPAVQEPAPAPALVEKEPDTAPASAPPAKAAEMTPATKEVMRKEIKARLRAAEEKSIAELKEIEGVRVLMRSNGDPEAVGIPAPLLFQAGISFQRDASKILNPLTRLIFSLGSTQVLILPEGTALGDAKVMDMRRTMGISAALYQAGVAPPRVQVNLLNTQLDLPKALADFKGVVVVFQYERPMNLVVDSAVGDDMGPPISLGIFPPQIRPARNQGALIEFSVSDPPAGLVSWRFSLLQPGRDGAELTPLQEVIGGGAVFHQIFWNGRQNFFGHPLPSGRYECVLTAMDAKNRRRTLHKWIEVVADAGEAQSQPVAAPAPATATREPAVGIPRAVPAPAAVGGAPSEDLAGAGGEPLVKGFSETPARSGAEIKKAPARARRKTVKRGIRSEKTDKRATESAAQAKEPAPTENPGQFVIEFEKNTHQMTDASEQVLARAAKTLSSYPLETLEISGNAQSDENEPEKLADRRAKLVIGQLINRYQIDPKRIQTAAGSGGAANVDIRIIKNDR